MKAAYVEPTDKGAYRVTLDVEAYKIKADSSGNRLRVPMDDYIEIGVFTAIDDGESPRNPLYLKMHHIRSEKQAITITVPQEPARVGIDPRNLLIDMNTQDNMLSIGQ